MFRMLVGVGVAVLLAVPSPAVAANHLYASNWTQGAVSTFSIGLGGILTQQGTGLTSAGSQPAGLAISANGQELYVANEIPGTVSTYSIGAGGSLTQVGTPVPTGNSSGTTNSGPFGVAVSPNGDNLYVANNLSGTVSAFSIGGGGALTQHGTGIATGSPGPGWVAVSPNGQNLYVTNYTGGTVSTFSIGAGGALTAQGGPVSTGSGVSSEPEDLAISPLGHNLYVANHGDGTVSTFSIGAGGALTPQGSAVPTGSGGGSGPEGVAMSPNGQDLYVANESDGTVSTFSIGTDGTLTSRGSTSPISGTTTSSQPYGAAVAPNGQALYVANFALGTVSMFSIGAGGTLTPLSAPVPSGSDSNSGPYELALSPDQGPSAAYSATVSPTQPTSTFNAQGSTAGSAPIAAYIWQFGDGASASGVNVTHAFAKPGTYQVTLTLVGADLCSALGPYTGKSDACAFDPKASVTHVVTVPAPPVASRESITGVARSTPKLAFTLTAGALAPPLETIAVKLPRGLSFSSRRTYLARHLTVAGANGHRVRFKAKLRHGVLTITLRTAQAGARVTIASPELAAAPRLVDEVKAGKGGKRHKHVKLTFSLTLTDTDHDAISLPVKVTAT